MNTIALISQYSHLKKIPQSGKVSGRNLSCRVFLLNSLNTTGSTSLVYDKNDELTVMCHGVVSGECDDSQLKAFTCCC